MPQNGLQCLRHLLRWIDDVNLHRNGGVGVQPPPSENTIMTSRQSFECKYFFLDVGGFGRNPLCWGLGGISSHDFRWFHALYPKQCRSLCKSCQHLGGNGRKTSHSSLSLPTTFQGDTVRHLPTKPESLTDIFIWSICQYIGNAAAFWVCRIWMDCWWFQGICETNRHPLFFWGILKQKHPSHLYVSTI